MELFKRTWAEVNLSAIEENYQAVRRRVGSDVRVMAVVKADAYGHGVAKVAPFLERHGVDFFGVSCLQEAVELREAGIVRPILILGYTSPDYFDSLLRYDLSQAVFTVEDAVCFSRIAENTGTKGRIHIAVDTGMGRIGFDAFEPEKTMPEILRIAALPGLCLEGLFTHFSVADTDGQEAYTEAQYRRFMAVKEVLNRAGYRPICHAANSAGVFLHQRYHLDMVRAGIVLYGLEPGGRANPFRPAMVIKTSISFLKELPAGRDISYGRHYTTSAPARIATLSAGYADGFPRALSGRGMVMIHGRRAPIVGTICMDQMMVDVTGIPCVIGDEAILMGDGIPFDLLAESLGTIHYELICGIGKRVPRIYLGFPENEHTV